MQARLRPVLMTLGLVVLVGSLSAAALKAAPSDYDANGDQLIDREEALDAIADYFFEGTLNRDEVLEIIEHYLFDIPVVAATPTPLPGQADHDQQRRVPRVRPRARRQRCLLGRRRLRTGVAACR